jgi:hypothetical protein
MRRIDSKEIHSEAFSARIEAVETLRAAGGSSRPDVLQLRTAADRVRAVGTHFGDAPNGGLYTAFAELIEIVALLGEWRSTVLDAGIDAPRFLTAAKERAAGWRERHAGTSPALGGLGKIALEVSQLVSIGDVPGIIAKLGAIPLPIGIEAVPTIDDMRKSMGFASAVKREDAPAKLAVAFVKFTLNGKPVEEIHHVPPGETHDIEIDVRISRWPDGATSLVLEPMTVEPPDTYYLPRFTFEKPPSENGPIRLSQRGRAVLKVPQHMNARPFEFIYAAKFLPVGVEQPVEVAGQRTLLLEGLDLARHPLTGYPGIDRALVSIRNTLRTRPQVSQQELLDALTVCFALGNYAGQVLQDNLIASKIDEAEFQRRLKTFLRSQPAIGVELEEHPHVAGGISDLSFRGIRIELKAESTQVLAVSDCTRYVGQAASYAVGSGKRIGVLCVLDCSEKDRPAMPAEDGIVIIPLQLSDGAPVYVITFLLQGNLAKPSSLSR